MKDWFDEEGLIEAGILAKDGESLACKKTLYKGYAKRNPNKREEMI